MGKPGWQCTWVQVPQSTNIRRLWILIHRRGSWKTGNLIEINALFEQLRDLDPLPRAYHVFEWPSNGKKVHVNKQRCYTPPFCFVKHILVFTKDHNIHTFNHSFPIHSMQEHILNCKLRLPYIPINYTHTINYRHTINYIHTMLTIKYNTFKSFHENVGKVNSIISAAR